MAWKWGHLIRFRRLTFAQLSASTISPTPNFIWRERIWSSCPKATAPTCKSTRKRFPMRTWRAKKSSVALSWAEKNYFNDIKMSRFLICLHFISSNKPINFLKKLSAWNINKMPIMSWSWGFYSLTVFHPRYWSIAFGYWSSYQVQAIRFRKLISISLTMASLLLHATVALLLFHVRPNFQLSFGYCIRRGVLPSPIIKILIRRIN